jgi:UDP-N-acetylmuramoylalanine--D-glutamate ligase
MKNRLSSPIVIVGMGISGEAALKLLLSAGYSRNEIFTFDDKSKADLNTAELVVKLSPKTLVVSPGYPLATGWIQSLKATGSLITNEISISIPYLENEKWIGVTGSVGKSTTVALLGEAIKVVDRNAFVGGNFGTPLAEYVHQVLDKKRDRADWGVLELSSYQLENYSGPLLDWAVLTYLTANHLERYQSKEEYYDTKLNILKWIKKGALINEQGGDLKNYLNTLQSNWHWVNSNLPELQVLELAKARMLGSHNQDNLAIAAKLGLEEGWPKTAFEAMKNYAGLSHRMENIGTFKDILFINDSKATTIESVLTAVNGILAQFPKTNSLHLLLGGKDKNLPWEDLGPLAKNIQIKPVFFGACGTLAKSKSNLTGPSFEKLNEGVDYIRNKAQAGDIVMLSPGGTSLDEFKNFEDRGTKFAEYVKRSFT